MKLLVTGACGSVEDAERVGFAPLTPVREGVAGFVSGCRDYYRR